MGRDRRLKTDSARGRLTMTLRQWSTAALVAAAVPIAVRAQPADVPVRLAFAAAFGADTFSCHATFPNIGRTHSTVKPVDFRLYLSHLRLADDRGQEVEVALTQDGKWQSG